MWGWGVMNSVAITEAANIRFPMENFIGVWWSGSENDVMPAGLRADGYKSLALNAPGMQNTDMQLPYSSLKCVDPFDQRYVLLTMGTRVLSPRPVDPLFPSLRIYGCFSDKSEASEHADLVTKLDNRCSLVIAKCGEWILFPQSEETRDFPEKALCRTMEKMKEHETFMKEQHREFEAAMKQEKQRKVRWNKGDWTDEQEEEIRRAWISIPSFSFREAFVTDAFLYLNLPNVTDSPKMTHHTRQIEISRFHSQTEDPNADICFFYIVTTFENYSHCSKCTHLKST